MYFFVFLLEPNLPKSRKTALLISMNCWLSYTSTPPFPSPSSPKYSRSIMLKQISGALLLRIIFLFLLHHPTPFLSIKETCFPNHTNHWVQVVPSICPVEKPLNIWVEKLVLLETRHVQQQLSYLAQLLSSFLAQISQPQTSNGYWYQSTCLD